MNQKNIITPENIRTCPICKKTYSDYPAKSRVNGSPICPACSVMEAIESWQNWLATQNTDVS